MTTDYDVGDLVRLTITVRDEAGTIADPAVVLLTVRKPDGTTSVVANSRTATGIYTAAVPIDQSGVWWYRWEGTGGAATTAEEGMLSVRMRQVPMVP